MRLCDARWTVEIGLYNGENVDGLDKLNMIRGVNTR